MATTSEVNKIYQDYIYKSRYARYLPELKRREEWPETVTRYLEFMRVHLADKYGYQLPKDLAGELYRAIVNKDVMPSMRALMTAGPALERDNVAGYNCAYVPIDDRKVFDEIMYILMCGTGVGFSVERKYVDRLPTVADEFHPAHATVHVADSRVGWATAYRKIISLLYDGLVPDVDYSRLRPAGARLKTFGGRSSGPEPLKQLVEYTIATFKQAKGRQLNALECHDLVCKIAEVIVCGGVRRSALLSLSNLTDERMRNAKSGAWYHTQPHRALANNSVCYTSKPDVSVFLSEWKALYDSKSGERGIFNRASCEAYLPERREAGHEWGTNPCSEIVLRPRQFCNLTEVVIRPEDTLETLKEKVKIATILGTWQSTLTDFRYLSAKWRENCEEERLLGVSLTGICDHPILGDPEHESEIAEILPVLRDTSISTNKETAEQLGINPSAAITCVKPSGTVSQLVGSSSGIHPRYSQYYMRRVRNDIKDPISQALIESGVPYEIDVTNPNQYVFSFPLESVVGKESDDATTTKTVETVSALEQLRLWEMYQTYWCEHKPSVSIYVRESEWIDVAAWVYDRFQFVSGISFFPVDDHIYRQAPYSRLTKDEYDTAVSEFPGLVGLTIPYEDTDSTTASQELACQGGSCEL